MCILLASYRLSDINAKILIKMYTEQYDQFSCQRKGFPPSPGKVGVEGKRWGGGGDDDSIFLYLTNLPLLALKKLVCDQSLGALDAFDSNKPRYTLLIFQDCKKLFFSKQ